MRQQQIQAVQIRMLILFREGIVSQLKMTDDGDIEIVENGFELVTNDEEIRQRLIQRLRMFLGEWFLDNTLGVPYFQIIFVKGAPTDLIQDLLKDTILQTVGIYSLERFDPIEYDPTTRQLAVSFAVMTINQALIELSEEIP